ncbi:MAG: flagellar basal body rod protein [Asticcacaulis sp. 32-58-5]|nr:MAG: flagellar basal body rod protein [Asticcacaulis sp. 32-58-5]
MLALNTAIGGLMSAQARFDKSAVKTVQDITQGKDVVSDFVDQIQARTAFEANISVIKSVNEVTGRLLDMKA